MIKPGYDVSKRSAYGHYSLLYKRFSWVLLEILLEKVHFSAFLTLARSPAYRKAAAFPGKANGCI